MWRGTEKANAAGGWLPVQASEAMRDGENVLSGGVMGSFYGDEVHDVRLPRKARTTIIYDYLYPKPTQVGW